MDQKFAKWDGCLNTIYKDVVSLIEHQQIFGKVQDIIRFRSQMSFIGFWRIPIVPLV